MNYERGHMKRISWIAVFLTFLPALVLAADGKPLKQMMPYDFVGLTEKEKEIYVKGVLDGQAFMLYGANHRDLDEFVNCVEREGAKKITQFSETTITLHPEEVKSPMPWAISRAMGIVCGKNAKKK